jgi:hypothetical protein
LFRVGVTWRHLADFAGMTLSVTYSCLNFNYDRNIQAFFAGIPPNLHRSLPHLKNCEVRDLSVWVSRAVESIDLDNARHDQ